MTYVPIGKNASKRLAGLVPTLDLLNVYAEVTETNPAGGYDLLTRPVLQKYATPDVIAYPIRGLYSHEATTGTLGGLYAGAGTGLYRVSQSQQSGEGLLGTISGPILPIQMAFGTTDALVASGGQLQTTDGTNLEYVGFPDNQLVLSVVYLNGYFIAAPAGVPGSDGASYLYYSDPTKNPTDTDFFTGDRRVGAVMTGGAIVRLEARGPEIVAFKTDGVEVFQPTGEDTLEVPPFQRVSGREYNRGTYQPYSITKIGETIAYVDSDSNVCLAAEQPVVISTPAVSEQVAAASGLTFYGWSLSWNTHDFYVLAIGNNTTLVCDISLSPPTWYQWSDQDGSNWKGIFGVSTAMGQNYVGDQQTGDVYIVTDAATLDDKATAMTQRGTGILALNQRAGVNNVSLDCAVGLPGSPTPSVELFISDDQGRTYVSHGVESLGGVGDTMERVRWTRLGQHEPPLLMFAFETDSPARWRFSNMRTNDPF